ncbi:RICIN domain-containing protein [Streptomyces sp. MBT53]|nr:RICIN domain-containing protein [Streptomyces sp. MBT53]
MRISSQHPAETNRPRPPRMSRARPTVSPASGQADQQWKVVNADGAITVAESGLCLDTGGQATGNGAKVQLWTCTGGTNQHWRLMN